MLAPTSSDFGRFVTQPLSGNGKQFCSDLGRTDFGIPLYLNVGTLKLVLLIFGSQPLFR